MSLPAWATLDRLIDLILLIMAVEFAGLSWRRRARGAGATIDAFFALAPGACLAAALRVAVAGGPEIWILAWLGAALPVHIADLWRRRF
jgi:hypothetical protein